jgi:hypothetical protein
LDEKIRSKWVLEVWIETKSIPLTLAGASGICTNTVNLKIIRDYK